MIHVLPIHPRLSFQHFTDNEVKGTIERHSSHQAELLRVKRDPPNP